MYRSSLRFPDRPAWRNDHGYSAIVAFALREAYRAITLPPLFVTRSGQGFLLAWSIGHTVASLPMSLQQHMHIYYLRAAAYIERAHLGPESGDLGQGEDPDHAGDLARAVDVLDKAEDIAEGLGETRAYTDVLSLRLIPHFWRSDLLSAMHDCERYLHLMALLETEDAEAAEIDRSSELEVLARLASFQALTADFPGALGSLDWADHLMKTAMANHPIAPSSLGNLLLARANILRLDRPRELMKALECAIEAVEIYRLAKADLSATRARTLVADIALDLAEGYSHDRASEAFNLWITLAKPYAEHARQDAVRANDSGGFGLAVLSQARLNLMSGANVDTRSQIQGVLGMARDLRDPGLQAQALTALGHDLMGRGERESALNAYRSVISHVRDNQVHLLEIIPRDALLRALSP